MEHHQLLPIDQSVDLLNMNEEVPSISSRNRLEHYEHELRMLQRDVEPILKQKGTQVVDHGKAFDIKTKKQIEELVKQYEGLQILEWDQQDLAADNAQLLKEIREIQI